MAKDERKMMRILGDETTEMPCVLALGMFDGVHRGHQALLLRGREMSEEQGTALCVCTFKIHPREIFDPENAPKHLTTVTERASLMAKAGVELMRVLPFTRRTASMPPEDFLGMLLTRFRPSGIVCGEDYTFGRYGSGNTEMLTAWADRKDIPIDIVSEVRLNGRRVSSTLIREKLAAGEIRQAAEYLGHHYTLHGIAEGGKFSGGEDRHQATEVSVPSGKQLPVGGVYAGQAEWKRMKTPALIRIGSCPASVSETAMVDLFLPEGRRVLTGSRVRLTIFEMLEQDRALAETGRSERIQKADQAEVFCRTEARR